LKARLAEIARATVLSPELLVLLSTYLVYFFWPRWFMLLGLKLQRADAGVLVTVVGAPVAATGLTWVTSKDLLHPSDSQRTILVEWPDYWRLRVRALLGLAWGVVGTVVTFIGVMLLLAGTPIRGGAVVFAGIAVAAATLLSAALAYLAMKDILDGARPAG
jgi:hypothetical protein